MRRICAGAIWEEGDYNYVRRCYRLPLEEPCCIKTKCAGGYATYIYILESAAALRAALILTGVQVLVQGVEYGMK